jgi:acyl-CoA thioesterase-1
MRLTHVRGRLDRGHTMTEENILSDRARDVLFFGRYYSSALEPCPVKAEHILLALILVDPDLFRILSATETDEGITALRNDLDSFDSANRESWVAPAPPPLSSDAKRVIKLAVEESQSLGHPYVGTEHLLLGLIRNSSSGPTERSGPSLASEILRARGFSVQRVRARVQTGSLTPQSGQGNRWEVLRALPDKGRPQRVFGFMNTALARLRGLFAILLVLGWANPAQFTRVSKARHTAPMEQSRRAGPVIYLALGDSTGLGLGAKNGYGYVEQLTTRIRNEHPGSRVVKLCTLGETTFGLGQRINEGLPVKPTLITLSIGINDLINRVSEEQFAANYEGIVKFLKRLAVPIVITNLPDFSSAPRLPNSLREEVRVKLILFNKRIEEVAKRYGLFLVDLYGPSTTAITTDPKFFSSDGFHPSEAGYEFWTRMMWPKVKIAIEERKNAPE